ncbi:MAG: twin-arginine translocase TatA/TatE family subunit [Candidatus Acidiferrales bacterium]
MLSVPHMIVIFVVVLVVFGPDKLPDLARNLGKVMGEFRRLTGEMRYTFDEHMRELERDATTRRTPPASPAASTTPGGAASPSGDQPAPSSQFENPAVGLSTPEHQPENTIASRPPNASGLLTTGLVGTAARPAEIASADSSDTLDGAHEPLSHLPEAPSPGSPDARPPGAQEQAPQGAEQLSLPSATFSVAPAPAKPASEAPIPDPPASKPAEGSDGHQS